MIRHQNREVCLSALHTIFYLARGLVLERPNELVQVFDLAEQLPLLFLGPHDQTERFRAILVELSECAPEFRLALSKYDEGFVGPFPSPRR